MSQQQAHSHQNHFDDSASYSAGYEESPRYQGYSADIRGQKLSPLEDLTRPTAQLCGASPACPCLLHVKNH